MQRRRLIAFLASIAAGFALGVGLAWAVLPVEPSGSIAAVLRADYKADYVLMVAEVFQQEGDAFLAQQRLAGLGGGDAIRTVQEAALTARDLGYDKADLDRFAFLSQGLYDAARTPAAVTP